MADGHDEADSEVELRIMPTTSLRYLRLANEAIVLTLTAPLKTREREAVGIWNVNTLEEMEYFRKWQYARSEYVRISSIRR